MNLAVVLVSEQTIPNVVYLKNLLKYGESFDKVLLITTEKMENQGKSDTITKALGSDFFDNKKYDKSLIDENMLFDINKKLEEYFENNSFDKVFVNITGGTKIMSLAAYNFFKDKSFTENIVYLPIGSTSYKQIYPLGSDGKAVDVKINYKMGVGEYLKSFDVEYEDSKALDVDLSRFIFKTYLEDDSVINKVTQILRKYRKDGKELKKINKSLEYGEIKRLLNKINIDVDKYNLKQRRWVDYFSGGWFEEYVYSEINELCIDNIKLNIKIKRQTNIKDVPNEFDVVFIKDNNLFVVECKTGNMEGHETTNALYKVAQLNRDLGLSAKSYFVSLSKKLLNKETKKSLLARSKLLGIDFVFRDDVENRGIKGFFERFQCR